MKSGKKCWTCSLCCIMCSSSCLFFFVAGWVTHIIHNSRIWMRPSDLLYIVISLHSYNKRYSRIAFLTVTVIAIRIILVVDGINYNKLAIYISTLAVVFILCNNKSRFVFYFKSSMQNWLFSETFLVIIIFQFEK